MRRGVRSTARHYGAESWESEGAICIPKSTHFITTLLHLFLLGFCQKWEVKFSYVQNWLAFAKVGGTAKSEYCPVCTSGTRTAKAKWAAYF